MRVKRFPRLPEVFVFDEVVELGMDERVLPRFHGQLSQDTRRSIQGIEPRRRPRPRAKCWPQKLEEGRGKPGVGSLRSELLAAALDRNVVCAEFGWHQGGLVRVHPIESCHSVLWSNIRCFR